MILTRKILGPTIFLFALLLIGLLGYFYNSYQTLNQQQEQLYLSTLNEGFGSEVENKEFIALGLAQEIANDPQVQKAFVDQDRAQLLAVSTPFFERMKQFNATELHFHNPPSTSFLRVQNPDIFGDDLSASREMVVTVNRTQQPAVGFETSQSGFNSRAVVPVFYQGRFIGSVEVGIDAGLALLGHFVEEYGNEWHIALKQEVILLSSPDLLPNLKDGPIAELLLYASTENRPIFNNPDAYKRALAGERVIGNSVVDNRYYTIFTRPIADHSGKIIGVLDIVIDRSDLVAQQNARLLIAAVTGFLVLVIAGLGITFTTSRTLLPISKLTSAAKEIAKGNLSVQIEAPSTDEIGELSTAFESMSTQMRESISMLEQRVSERTQDLERRTLELETISDVVREISIIRNTDTLLNVSANLIRERFNYYHIGIYLLDERGEYAFLRAASGTASEQLLEQGYKLRIGEMGPAAGAFQGEQYFVSQAGRAGHQHIRNALLPDSKSEIILPLRVLNINLGALDIHSSQVVNFDDRGIRTLRLLADQLAAAIKNAQLAQQVEETVNRLNKSYRMQTRQAWQTTVNQHPVSSYEYDGRQIRPVPYDLPAGMLTQFEAGKAVIVLNEDQVKENQETLLVPLMVLNQLIGVIGIEKQDPTHTWTEEEIAIAEATANRAAITLENARLLEESQQRAAKERAISEATSRIGTTLNVENILSSTVDELERVLGNSDVILQIRTESAPAVKS